MIQSKVVALYSVCLLHIFKDKTFLEHTLSKNKVNNNNNNFTIMLFVLLKNFNIKLFSPPQKEGMFSPICWFVSSLVC